MAIEGWQIGSPELEILCLSPEQLQCRQQQWKHSQPAWKTQNKDEGKPSWALCWDLYYRYQLVPNCILWQRRHHSTRTGLWRWHLYSSASCTFQSLMTWSGLVPTIFLAWTSVALSLRQAVSALCAVLCHAMLRKVPANPRATWGWSFCLYQPTEPLTAVTVPLSNTVGYERNNRDGKSPVVVFWPQMCVPWISMCHQKH